MLVSGLGSDLRYTVDWGRKWLVNFNVGKIQLVLFNTLSHPQDIQLDLKRFN